MPKVILESAGTHGFDMRHLRRSGAEELIAKALEKANITSPHPWRVRINEKQNCSGATQPFIVTGYKPWCIYMRIKPGDNNTCHNVSLIVPTGVLAEKVYNQLSTIQKTLSRNWRKVETVDSSTVMTSVFPPSFNLDSVLQVSKEVVEEVAAVMVPEEETVVATLPQKEETVKKKPVVAKWLKNENNIKCLLLEVYNIEQLPPIDHKHVMKIVCKGTGLSLSYFEFLAMMKNVIQKGYVNKKGENGEYAGYSLTELGRQQIAELLDTAPESRVTKLRKFSKVVGTVYTASQRLLAIETEREVLQQKLKALDAEEVELCKVLDNKGIENLVSKFTEV